jgi:hypothetical protein
LDRRSKSVLPKSFLHCLPPSCWRHSPTALSPQSAAAAYGSKGKRAAPVVHRGHHGYYATYGWSRARYSGALPYGPEYGFLHHVPPNAIQMPGYTFVPGVGILGESCDLPTSACTNEYRDVK